MSKLMKFVSKFVVAALAISFVGAVSPAQAAQTGDLTVTIHYARQAGDFTGRYAWIWYSGTGASGTFTGTGVVTAAGGAWVPVDNNGIDSYGAVSTFTLVGGKNIDKFGIIECSTNSWGANNCGRDLASSADRFITVSSLETEVWLRSGSAASADTTIYTSDSLSPNAVTSQTVRVHYNRTDANYTGWKLHLGTESKIMASTYWVSPKSYDFDATNPVGYTVGTDQFGAYIETTLAYYAGQTKTINMVVYSLDGNNAWVKDGGNVDGNRYLAADASGTTNIWLVSGDTTGDAAFATEPVIVEPTPTASPAPAISDISPVSATIGSEVTLSGTDLQLDTTDPTVEVGGIAASLTSVSPTSVSFTVPEGLSVGDTTVTLTTANGSSNSVTLTIVDNSTPGAPVIDSFAPDAAHRGDVVVINGSGLLDAVVTLEGIEAPLDAVSSDTWVSFTVPSDLLTGTYLVTVSTAIGSTSAGYAVLPDAPTISSVTDLQGNPLTTVQQGDIVVINGTNFTDVLAVAFSGQDADLTSQDVVLTDTAITVVVPESISGVVSVTTPGGTATSDSLTFLNIAAPSIDSIDPLSARGGDTVFINGAHLLGGSVTIGGYSATNIVTTSTLLTVTMPPGLALGDASVVLTTEGGSASSSIIVLPDAPTISGVSVLNAYIGDVVTVYGTGFAGASDVSFNGVSADLTNPSFFINGDGTELTVVVPDGATSGFISVTTENGTGSFDGFTIGDIAPTETPTPTETATPTDSPTPDGPNISLFDPQAVQSGDVVTIIGSNFGNNPVITIGGFSAEVIDCGTYIQDGSGIWNPDFNNCDPGSLLVVVPDGLTVGSAEVVVTWDNQTTATSSLAIVADPPSIDGLSDQSGKAGDVITIYGSHLTDITSITFDGDGSYGPVEVDLSNYLVNPDGSSVTLAVPDGATSGTITVTTLSGFAVSEDIFDLLPAPTVDSLSATSGKVGDSVTITGTNLDSVVSVLFNDIEADLTDFNTEVAEDGTSIVVVVPEGATTGNITVVTSGGSATSADVFTISDGPSITSLGSLMGKPGALLTINGIYLNGVQSVSFDGDELSEPVLADLSSPQASFSDTLITVVVPVGATSGTITVTTDSGVTTSEDIYEIVQAPEVSSMSTTSVKSGGTMVIRGSGFTWAKVRVRGKLASISANSTDSVLNITIPEVTVGRTTLVITTPGGTISKSVTITTPAPIIKSFTQSASKKRGVGTVVVTGQNLAGATIKVGKVAAKVRAGSTATRLVFTLPTRAAVTSKGIFTLTTDGGVVKSKATLKVTSK